jgi:predicted flap endonuclease-1-like 5' DNA nuclease
LPPRPAVAAIAAPAAPKRPAGLSVPRGGVPDNLQRIKGIGRRNEELLNRLGIFHFGQIAAWTPSEVMWVGQHLVFPERISRDDWLGQATVLAMGAETGFQKSAERRRERRRSERAFEARMATASASHDESGARDSESEHSPKPSGVAGDVDLPALDGDGALVGDDGAAEADVPAEESDSEKDRLTALADDEEPDAPR